MGPIYQKLISSRLWGDPVRIVEAFPDLPDVPSGLTVFSAPLDVFTQLTAQRFLQIYELWFQGRFGRSLDESERLELARFARILEPNPYHPRDRFDTVTLAGLRRALENDEGFPGVCYEAAEESQRIIVSAGFPAVMIGRRTLGQVRNPATGNHAHFVEAMVLGEILVVDLVADCYEATMSDTAQPFDRQIRYRPLGVTIVPKVLLELSHVRERAPAYTDWELVLQKAG